MDQDQEEQRESLEQQLQWTKGQIRILDEMDGKLNEMKRIAQYVVEHTLTEIEVEWLNNELNVLKDEFSSLKKQYYPVLQ